MHDEPRDQEDRIGHLSDQLRDLSRTVNEDLVPTLSRVEATLKESKDRHESEIGALFLARREHEARITAVERDYRSQEICDRRHDQIRIEGQEQTKIIGHLTVSVTKLLTVASVIAAVVSASIQLAIILLRAKL